MSKDYSVVTSNKSGLIAPILLDSAEAQIMRALRRKGRISRSEVTSITGWSKAKASQEIRSLVNRGLLVEIGEGVSQGGRKPGLLRGSNHLGSRGFWSFQLYHGRPCQEVR